MVDPGEGPGRPLIFGPNWGPKCQKNFGGETGSPLTKGLDDRPPPPPPHSPLISRSGCGNEAPLHLGPLTCLKCMVVPMAVLFFSGNVFGNNPEEVVGIRARFSLRSIFQWKLLSSSSLKESCFLIIFSYSTCRCYSQARKTVYK